MAVKQCCYSKVSAPLPFLKKIDANALGNFILVFRIRDRNCEFRSTTNLNKVVACFVRIWVWDWVHTYFISQATHKLHNLLHSTKILNNISGLVIRLAS